MDEQQQQMMAQLVQLGQQIMQQNPQMAKQLLQEAQQEDPQQLMEKAQNGDEKSQYKLALLVYAQQAQMARFGAKLNYIKHLRGQCPDGYEATYFKSGGRLCKKCVTKQKRMEYGGKTPTNPVDAFKCGRKIKKKK